MSSLHKAGGMVALWCCDAEVKLMTTSGAMSKCNRMIVRSTSLVLRTLVREMDTVGISTFASGQTQTRLGWSPCSREIEARAVFSTEDDCSCVDAALLRKFSSMQNAPTTMLETFKLCMPLVGAIAWPIHENT